MNAKIKQQWNMVREFFNTPPSGTQDLFFGLPGIKKPHSSVFEVTSDYCTFIIYYGGNNPYNFLDLCIKLYVGTDTPYSTIKYRIGQYDDVEFTIKKLLSESGAGRFGIAASQLALSIDNAIKEMNDLNNRVIFEYDPKIALKELVDKLSETSSINEIINLIENVVSLAEDSEDETIVLWGNALKTSTFKNFAFNVASLKMYLDSDESKAK